MIDQKLHAKIIANEIEDLCNLYGVNFKDIEKQLLNILDIYSDLTQTDILNFAKGMIEAERIIRESSPHQKGA